MARQEPEGALSGLLGAHVSKTVCNYVAGLCGGLISATTGYPLDVARVRLLFGTAPMVNMSNGFWYTFNYNILKSGLVWPIQRTMQERVDKSHIEGWKGIVLSGAIGNVIPGILLNPFNVIKVRFMETHQKLTTVSIVRAIVKDEGVRAFKRGLEATILRDLIWGMLYFPIFHAVEMSLAPSVNSLAAESAGERAPVSEQPASLRLMLVQGVTSAVAAGVATLLTSFIDGVRLFQMKSAAKGEHHTFMQGLRLAVMPNRRNLLATATGVGRVTVTTVIGHVTYLQVMRFLEQ